MSKKKTPIVSHRPHQTRGIPFASPETPFKYDAKDRLDSLVSPDRSPSNNRYNYSQRPFQKTKPGSPYSPIHNSHPFSPSNSWSVDSLPGIIDIKDPPSLSLKRKGPASSPTRLPSAASRIKPPTSPSPARPAMAAPTAHDRLPMDKQTTQKITGHETTDDERTTDSETEDECHPANPTYAADDNDAVVIVPRRPNLSLSNPQRRPQNPSATRPKMLPYQRSPSPILAPVQPDPAIVAADKDLEKDSYNVTLMLPHKRKRPLRSKIEARSPAPVMTVSDLPAFCLENTTNDQVECPYCHEILRLDESEKVANTYAEIKDKDKRKTTSMDRSAFCQLHSLELELKPLAIENGWPLTIDFDKLPDRVLRLKTELDRVIFQLDPSDYLSLALDAYRVLGKNKARSTFGAIARFEKVIPGYYGAKGASLILDQLQAMYKNILLKNLTEPQTPTEYMQQVLMPEVGYRLILQDLRAKGDRNHRDLENMAKKTMLASATFGSFMYPIHEGLDEDPSSSFAVTDSDDD